MLRFDLCLLFPIFDSTQGAIPTGHCVQGNRFFVRCPIAELVEACGKLRMTFLPNSNILNSLEYPSCFGVFVTKFYE